MINLILCDIINKQRMQNHLQYQSSNFASQSANTQYPPLRKMNTFEKSAPSLPLKHYTSNPNLSLEFNQNKMNSYSSNNEQFTNGTNINKNIQYRNHNFGMGSSSIFQNNHVTEKNRRGSQMTKSLIIGAQSQKIEIPEQPAKREGVKGARRPHRMSQVGYDDSLKQQFVLKKDDANTMSTKQINFYKVKDSADKQQDKPRTIPSFLSRNNDMKRSMVQNGYDNNKGLQYSLFNSRDLIKPKKKVTVDDFVKIKQLGKGKYGQVFLVRQKCTGFISALKVIQKKLLHQEQITDQFIREIKIQMFLNHPNIIKMYGYFDDATNIYIILEVGTGGQLYHQLKRAQPLPQPRIAFIMRQVCDAVNQIHSLKIIHRDIKPENIVLHDNIIKLCDFGWSVYQDNKLRTTFCGTPLYVCPEILKGRQYDQKIDIWSIGIMMYEMVVGENPFKITRQQQLIKIVKDQIKIPSYLFVSAEVRDFLDRCLQKNPQDRANIKQLIAHSFFKKNPQKGGQKSKMINMDNQ